MVAAALGASLRAYIHQLPVLKNKDMPYSTMAINIAGAFLMGFTVMLVAENTQYYLIIVTGFLGGFTTYSQINLISFVKRKQNYSLNIRCRRCSLPLLQLPSG